MDSNVPKTNMLIAKSEAEIDASNLLVRHDFVHARSGGLIEEVELKPSEQTRIFLGHFEPKSIICGFSVTVKPEIANEEVIRQITKLELQDGRYELILHIANYSNTVASIEIWQLQAKLTK